MQFFVLFENFQHPQRREKLPQYTVWQHTQNTWYIVYILPEQLKCHIYIVHKFIPFFAISEWRLGACLYS